MGGAAWGLDLTISGTRGGTVSITSSTSGVLITDHVDQNLKISVPATAASAVCVTTIDAGVPCSTITNPALYAPCIPAGQAYEFPVREYGWAGGFCGLLETGSVAVSITFRDPW